MDRGVERDALRHEGHRADGGGEDGGAGEREVDAAEQRRLQQLQVALVARGELGDDAERLDEAGLRGCAAAAQQLEHIRVALLRHDRRAGGERVGQLHERELLRVEEADIGGEAAEVLHQERDLEQQLRFRLAARQLHGGDRRVHLGEVERLAGSLAVERQAGRAVARGRTERVLVDAAAHGAQARGVVAQLGGEPARPQRDAARHRLLHVCVARQLDIALPVGERIERGGDGLGALRQFLGGIAQVEAQRGEHLVVARAAEMHAPARCPDERGQPALERGLAVLVLQCDPPLALGVGGGERLEPLLDGLAVGVGEQPLRVQHLRVRDRGAGVVGDQTLVERVVLARREREHALIERRALVPEAAHGCALPAASSAGASLRMSATTSVPVPSLVNTSARIASGAL